MFPYKLYAPALLDKPAVALTSQSVITFENCYMASAFSPKRTRGVGEGKTAALP
jgi:hypothetical protein